MINQPLLPYNYEDLEPALSKEQVRIHYEDHHLGYYKNLLQLIEKFKLEQFSIHQLMHLFKGPVYNNAAQVWLHSYFWKTFSPTRNKLFLNSNLSKIIQKNTSDNLSHSLQILKEQTLNCALNGFGSGYVAIGFYIDSWPEVQLSVRFFQDASTPMEYKFYPLILIDCWEHSFYLDYKKNKKSYIENMWDLINWSQIESRFNNYIEIQKQYYWGNKT
jgi:Fe-Mn family superoxide dismutase